MGKYYPGMFFSFIHLQCNVILLQALEKSQVEEGTNSDHHSPGVDSSFLDDFSDIDSLEGEVVCLLSFLDYLALHIMGNKLLCMILIVLCRLLYLVFMDFESPHLYISLIVKFISSFVCKHKINK